MHYNFVLPLKGPYVIAVNNAAVIKVPAWANCFQQRMINTNISNDKKDKSYESSTVNMFKTQIITWILHCTQGMGWNCWGGSVS